MIYILHPVWSVLNLGHPVKQQGEIFEHPLKVHGRAQPVGIGFPNIFFNNYRLCQINAKCN